MNEISVLVIVINWNNAADTIDCVESLMHQSHQNFDLIVVDNASEQSDFQMLQKHCQKYPNIQLFQNSENVGFTHAVNQCLDRWVIGEKKYQFVGLLNNDAKAEKHWLKNLIRTAQKKPNTLIASQIRQQKNSKKIDSAGLYVLDTGEVLPRGYNEKISRYEKAEKVLGPCGGAALYPVKILEQIGVFDHSFPMGYEDVEFALRAFTQGITTWYEPSAIVHHKGSVSINKIKDTEFLIQTQYQLWRAFLRHAPGLAVMISIPFGIIRLTLVFLWWIISFQWKTIAIWIRAIGRIIHQSFNIWTERKIAQKKRTISTFKFLRYQKSFLSSDLGRAWRRFRSKQKSYFNS